MSVRVKVGSRTGRQGGRGRHPSVLRRGCVPSRDGLLRSIARPLDALQQGETHI